MNGAQATLSRGATSAVASDTADMASHVRVTDDVLDEALRRKVLAVLNRGTWAFGWKSNAKTDVFSFWHKHFAGNVHPDHQLKEGRGQQYDCADELLKSTAEIHEMWQHLQGSVLAGQVLQRCYANGAPYGSEGSLHTDSVSPLSSTAIYYPHETWDPNWGGETLFFNREKTDLVTAIYPRPNRLVVFPGTIPHVARGVSRICPTMRITLMFKTEIRNEAGSVSPN